MDYTPRSAKALSPLVLRTLLCFAEPLTEQASAARLCKHRLARSCLSAPPPQVATVQKGQISPSTPKKERCSTPEWVLSIFGGEGEIWTLAPEKPDLHP